MFRDNFTFHIVGAGRGGTSLLAGLLDYHPKLEIGFERASCACLMGQELPYQGTDLFRKRVEAYISACTKVANRFPRKIWGNKITTEQIFCLEDHNRVNPDAPVDVLDAFFNQHLGGKAVVFVLRDGRSCINSKVSRTGQPITAACERWQYSVACYKFFQTRHPNSICVRFEDLLDKPEPTLSAICDFLGVQYHQKMLRGTINKKMRPEYRNNTLDPSKATAIALPEAQLLSIKADLQYCGYL